MVRGLSVRVLGTLKYTLCITFWYLENYNGLHHFDLGGAGYCSFSCAEVWWFHIQVQFWSYGCKYNTGIGHNFDSQEVLHETHAECAKCSLWNKFFCQKTASYGDWQGRHVVLEYTAGFFLWFSLFRCCSVVNVSWLHAHVAVEVL